jgi:phospholipase C
MRVFSSAFILLFTAAALGGCGGNSGSMFGAPENSVSRPSSGSSPSPIAHVVIVVQENRTFNDFFATFPGADGTTTGNVAADPNCSPPIKQGTVALKKMPLVVPSDLNHRYSAYHTADDGGKMDGFDLVPGGKGDECTYPYQYTDPLQIQPYVTMATQYTLAEHMFTTQGSDSFTAHQDLIRGGTIVEKGKAMVDLPTCGPVCFWGCDAPAGTHTHLITKDNKVLNQNGPFPCSKNFSVAYPTLRDLLDAKSLSWKYYLPAPNKVYGQLLSAFDAVAAVRYGPEWKTNVVYPETTILNDVSSNKLPAVSWVIPTQNNSDHPGTSSDNGPAWVASIVNAIGTSSYWGSTAIVVVWDDWGGLYDNVAPTITHYGGRGFRVPALIISPYARAGYISPTNYEFGSILRYIEDNWNLGSLGTTDQTSTSILNCFDYHQTPIRFKPIQANLSKEYFLHEKPSRNPPDNDM